MMNKFEKAFGKRWILHAHDANGDLAVGIYESLERAYADANLFVCGEGGKCLIAEVIDCIFEEDLRNAE